MFSKKIVLIVLAVLILAGAWVWRHRSSPKSVEDSPALEELQALPYVQWSKSGGTANRTGVTKFDPQRSWHGYNLFTNDVNTALLMDMGGKILHKWYFGKKKKCEYVHLLSDGSILGVSVGQGITKVDWDSNLIWNSRFFAHHDIEPEPNGNFMTIRREMNREYKGRRVVFDALQRLSADGEPLEKWYTYDHLDELQPLHKPLYLDIPATEESGKRYDYYHLNTIKLLPDNPHGRTDKRFQQGNILICLRNANLIAILDKQTMKVVWSFGPDVVDWPHLPVMLPSGNILIFDNGTHRKWSRVIEVNPLTRKIVWSYGNPNSGFFSYIQGSAQRLPNGNTLICESMQGRVFEVNPSGRIVWEFWNPEMRGENRKTIYRFMRIPIDSVPAGLLQPR